jgi:hypothetical protein
MQRNGQKRDKKKSKGGNDNFLGKKVFDIDFPPKKNYGVFALVEKHTKMPLKNNKKVPTWTSFSGYLENIRRFQQFFLRRPTCCRYGHSTCLYSSWHMPTVDMPRYLQAHLLLLSAVRTPHSTPHIGMDVHWPLANADAYGVGSSGCSSRDGDSELQAERND